MKKIRKYALIALAAFLIGLFVSCLISTVLFRRSFDTTISDASVWLIATFIAGAVIAMPLFREKLSWRSKKILDDNADMENSHFLTMKELKRNKGYTVTTFDNINKYNDGIVVWAEVKKKKMNVVLRVPIHTIVVGSTGSGKGQTFVEPNLEMWARSKSKPSVVVTDPKGELFEKHVAIFKERGYNVHVIDLVDIFYSSQWNPLQAIIDKTMDIKNAKVTQENGSYFVLGQKYAYMEDAEQAVREFSVITKSEIFEDLKDLIFTMNPVESTKDPTWERGARDCVLGVAVGLWEDLYDGAIEPYQFNLYNLFKNITAYCVPGCADLKEYVKTRRKNSSVPGLTNTVANNNATTQGSYLGQINQCMSWLTDSGITTMTASNTIDLSNFDEEPNILFLKIPDEKDTRYKLVTLFVVQMYKSLVEKARKNLQSGRIIGDARLLRNCYFMMDEFGNMPNFPSVDKIVTVGRSRQIYLVPIIQGYEQLKNKYGEDVANTIKSNCDIKVFIRSDDANTLEEFSKSCGNKKIKQTGYSESNDTTMSLSVQSMPLITTTELAQLNDVKNNRMGNQITKVGGFPIRGKVTAHYKALKFYTTPRTKQSKGKFIDLDEENVGCDLKRITELISIDNILLESEKENNETYEPPVHQEQSFVPQEFSELAFASNKTQEKNNKVTSQKPKKIDIRAKYFAVLKNKIIKLQKWLSGDEFASLSQEHLHTALVELLLSLIENYRSDSFVCGELIELLVYVRNGEKYFKGGENSYDMDIKAS